MTELHIKLALTKLFERGFMEGDFNVMAFNALCDNFKQLGAAEERERIKAANAPEIERINAYLKSLEDAVQAEREECAKLADAKLMDTSVLMSLPPKSSAAWSIAAAIRARGNT